MLAKLSLYHQHPNITDMGSSGLNAFRDEGSCANICEEEPAKGSGDTVDKRLKSMIKELGDAINNSLSDSEQIAEVISRIKAGGYDVFVVLEATIGFNEADESEEQEERQPALQRASADYKMTAEDRKFLQSLRISLEDSD
jgi:hypothetical protein